MPALDALTVRQTLVDQSLTDGWRGFVRGFIRNGLGTSGAFDGTGPDWLSGRETDMTRGIVRAVRMAESYYVTPAMAGLVDARADAWADDDHFAFEDLPSPAGVLYIPAAITDTGSDGWTINCSVAVWHRVGDRLRLMFLYDKRNPTVAADLRGQAPETYDLVPDYMLLQVYDLRALDDLPQALRPSQPLPAELRSELVMTLSDDQYTAKATDRVTEWMGTSGATIDLVPDRLVVWLYSCLRLMRENLPAIERVGTPTGMRRGLTRCKLRNLHVTVIEYRHRDPGPERGGTHEYSHRFLRRGHNRRVWYRDPETGQLAQRVVWIKPTVVLAHREDLPLLMREHVNALTR